MDIAKYTWHMVGILFGFINYARLTYLLFLGNSYDISSRPDWLKYGCETCVL